MNEYQRYIRNEKTAAEEIFVVKANTLPEAEQEFEKMARDVFPDGYEWKSKIQDVK